MGVQAYVVPVSESEISGVQKKVGMIMYAAGLLLSVHARRTYLYK